MWALLGVIALSVAPGWPGARGSGPPLLVAQADAEPADAEGAEAEAADAEAAETEAAETEAAETEAAETEAVEAEAAEAEAVEAEAAETEAAEAEAAETEAEAESAVAEEIRATEVSGEEEPVAVKADGGTVVEDVEEAWVLQKTRELTSTGDKKRPWHVSGALTYRGLLVVDPDPSNDQYFSWSLRGDFDVFEGGRLWLRLGLTQNFTAEEGESGFLFQDASLGFDYGHEVALDFIPLEAFQGETLDFEHRAGLFLPTSRASTNQDMYAAPYALSRARYNVLEPLIVGLDAWFRYRFHRYAERAGQQGGMNTQLDFGLSMGVEYVPLSSKEWGTVSVGADLGWGYNKKYASREEFESEASSQDMWTQDYSWDVYATYTPVKYATVVVGMEQAANVLRDGIVNVNPFHRDETQYFLQVLARY